jgi:seryl-tRNA synthetase
MFDQYKITVYVLPHCEEDNNSINQKLNQIMATQAELAQQLRDVTAQNEKARQEILKKISDLEQAIIDAGNTSPEVDEALTALKASVQTDDDIVPDTTEPTV